MRLSPYGSVGKGTGTTTSGSGVCVTVSVGSSDGAGETPSVYAGDSPVNDGGAVQIASGMASVVDNNSGIAAALLDTAPEVAVK